MGCATSKLDHLPAVALCRERCAALDDAGRLRYSLSNHHFSYFLTLSSLSRSFPSFFPPLPHHDPPPSSPPKPKPKPNLPPAAASSSSVAPGAVRASGSGSHIDFDGSDSDSDSDSGHIHLDSDDLSHLHDSDNVPQLQHFPGDVDLPPGLGGFLGQGGFFHMNYMRNKASTPYVVFEQRPVSYQTVQFGEASSSSSGMLPRGYRSSSPYSDSAAGGGAGGVYPNYGYRKDGTSGGYYGNSPQQQTYGAAVKSPPPPPSPPRASAWDFFNPFESYEKYYPAYTPSRDSREVREEEGIPDLEDEHEVVKEVHVNPRFVDLGKSRNHARKGVVVEEEDEDDDEDEFHRKVDSESSTYQARPSVISVSNDEGNDDGPEYEVHVVDKKVVDGEGRSGQGGGGVARGSRSVAEALAAIEVQLRQASECGSEVSRMLEVGKLPYSRKHRGNHTRNGLLM